MVKQEKQRYVLFKIIRDEEFEFEKQDFIKELWKSVWRYFGMKEANKIGLWLQEFDLTTNIGILRCTHETKEILITSLSLMREINGKRIIFSPMKTSGTLKALKRKYINS